MTMGWDLLSTLQQQAFERNFWDTQPPMACPRCGEPMRQGPPDQPSVLFCIFDGFLYPDDWDQESMSGM